MVAQARCGATHVWSNSLQRGADDRPPVSRRASPALAVALQLTINEIQRVDAGDRRVDASGFRRGFHRLPLASL